ncbi:MAG: S1 RNA-binding domain-containing protein, partial [Pseudomonadota bacterium]|nr:S1 RNA-binding domain-containing protein [Pseudomonadota bacterium]
MSESFAQMLEESLSSDRMQPGAIFKATVISVDHNVVVVNAGLKSDSAIPVEQFYNEQGQVDVKVGDEIEVALESVEDGFGETRMSREKAVRAHSWVVLEQAMNDKETVIGIITGKVKGGYTVELNGIRAFLPGSLVDVRPVRDAAHLEGKTLEFKVVKLDRRRN